MFNFLLADFVACLNNAKRQHLSSIKVHNTKLIRAVLSVFIEQGLIIDLNIEGRKIEVFLKYVGRKCVFQNIKLVSLPSRRYYATLLKLRKIKDRSNSSIYIVSTYKGLKTDFECVFEGLAGEVLLKIEL